MFVAVWMTPDTSVLSVTYHGVHNYYVCADQWTSAFSDVVCQQLGHESVLIIVSLFTNVHVRLGLHYTAGYVMQTTTYLHCIITM